MKKISLPYTIAVLIWMSVIFYLSAIPDLASGLPNIYDTIFRKLGHMVMFGVLALLYAQMLRVQRARLWALVLTVLYAMSDEYHQTFTQGREGALLDVLIDAAGAVLALIISKNIIRNGKRAT